MQTQQAEIDVAVNSNAIYFIDAQRGWAVGSSGTILFTDDGGKTWNTPEYERYPAGWYYLLCLSLLIFTGWNLKRRQDHTETQQTITDLLASDRPLQASDSDPLGFNEIAQGLSRFIRNPRTEPPLTIAITEE